MPQSMPLSSHSPSVASSCSFDSDYDDGLVIEEIDSDDEANNVELIEGEYEDPPSDDDEYRARWQSKQHLNDTHNMDINSSKELSTPLSSSITLSFLSSQHLYTPPISPAPSTGSKRSFRESETDGEETDKEDNHPTSHRKTRRRLTPNSPSPLRAPVATQTTQNNNVSTPWGYEMEE